jgi:hypothetical protein
MMLEERDTLLPDRSRHDDSVMHRRDIRRPRGLRRDVPPDRLLAGREQAPA